MVDQTSVVDWTASSAESEKDWFGLPPLSTTDGFKIPCCGPRLKAFMDDVVRTKTKVIGYANYEGWTSEIAIYKRIHTMKDGSIKITYGRGANVRDHFDITVKPHIDRAV